MKKIINIKIFLDILIVAFISIPILYNMYHFSDEFIIKSGIKLGLSILIAIRFVLIGKGTIGKREKLMLMIALALLSVLWCVFQPIFSIVDESVHFANIYYISENFRLPIINERADMDVLRMLSGEDIDITLYEAVQTPVYYILMAVLCVIFSFASIQFRFWLCRIMGCIFLVLIFGIILVWVKCLKDADIIKPDSERILVLIAFLLLSCSGSLTRFATVSNEGLVSLLSAGCLCLFTDVILNGISKRKFWLCNILIILALLTKVTVAFAAVLWIIILLYYKKIKGILVSLVTMGLGVSPWVLFNLANYGALTGMKEHVKIVIPILNPMELSVDVVSGVVNIFDYFITPQERAFSHTHIGENCIGFINIGLWGCFIIFLFCICKILYQRYAEKKYAILSFDYSDEEKKLALYVVYILAIVGNISVLVLGTIGTKVSLLLGRYLFVSFIPLIFIIFKGVWGAIVTQYRMVIMAVISAVMIFLCMEDIIDCTSNNLNALTGKMLRSGAAIDVKNVVMSDIVFENGVYYSGETDPIIIYGTNINKELKEVKFEIYSEMGGVFKLYYAVNGEYSETYAIEAEYTPQTNSVIFTIPTAVEVSSLRIDPPSNCEFSIKNITIYW